MNNNYNPPPPTTNYNTGVNSINTQQQPYQVPPPPVNNNYLPQPQQPMTQVKQPFSNDIKQQKQQQQPMDGGSKVPDYGANTSGITPIQKEQYQMQQQQQQAANNNGYPGVIGGTPSEFKGIQGYDAQGNPIIPPFIAQRHQIEQSLGATCNNGGYHDLRMLLTNTSLLVAILIVPYCCGYRGKRVCTCTKCKEKFPNIVLPSPSY